MNQFPWEQRSRRVITFDLVKLIISIIVLLALVGIITPSIELCLWLILGSQAALVFTWEK